jgi:predicted TPR repeat methyltransferase
MKKMPDDSKEGIEKIPDELTVEDAIELAKRLQLRLGLDEAETIYRRILAMVPEHPDAQHFLGLLQYQRGQPEEAVRLISLALRAAPEYTDAHNNLGNIYRELDRLDEAESCYRRVVELSPGNADAYNNLGTVLRAKGLLSEAVAAYQKAIDLDPKFYNPHYNMGNLLRYQGKMAEAQTYYAQAVVLDIKQPGGRRGLGMTLSSLGRVEEAASVFREWAEKEPDNPEALHMLAACSGEDVPMRAANAYIKYVFDRFAESFEERLECLEYRAPELIFRAVARICGEPAGDRDLLDAGCGTGLCGPLLRPYARRLEGVDLSPKMLVRAKSTGSYDALEEAELTGFIASQKDAYDVIVSADALCYFGELQEVMTAVAKALKPDGFFIFTVERSDEGDGTAPAGFHFRPSGRYSHQESFINRTIAEAGMQLVSMAQETLRHEMGRPVSGLVVIAAARNE